MSHLQPTNGPTEPLMTVAGITAAATAVLALAVSFGLPVTADQQTAILGIVAVAAPIVVGWLGRGKVYSPASVARIRQGAGE